MTENEWDSAAIEEVDFIREGTSDEYYFFYTPLWDDEMVEAMSENYYEGYYGE